MSDPILSRYNSIARRVQALLETPEPAPAEASPEVQRMLSDAIHRLGQCLEAMPGARHVPSAQDYEHLIADFDRLFPPTDSPAGTPRA